MPRVLLTVALVLSLAYGALAIGAVYPWGYIPLGIGCLVVAAVACLPRRDVRLGRPNIPLAIGLALVALVIVSQLIPLPHQTLTEVSPGTDAFLQRYDLQYAALRETEGLLEDVAGAAQNPGAPGLKPGGPTHRLREGEAQNPGAPGLKPGGPTHHPISIEPDKTQLGLGLFAGFAILLLALTRGLTSRDVRRLAPAIVALGVLIALVAVIQKGSGSNKAYGLWLPFSPDAIPFGPFVNRNHFAGWMLMALPVGLGYFFALLARGMRGVKPEWHYRLLWFSSKDASRVILVGVGLLVMGLSLVLSLSRSGITCFTLALLVSGIVAIRRQARRAKRALAASYIVLVFVLALGWVGIDTIAARFDLLPQDYQQRSAIWNDTLAVFRDFPVFGAGLDTLGTAMSVYQTADEAGTHVTESHNDYLQLLAEGGIAIAFAACILLIIAGVETRRRFKRDTDDEMTYWIRVGAVTGVIAIVLQEGVEFSLQMPGNAVLFAVLLAIAVSRLPHRESRTRRADC